jgi:hypothetical protein
LEWQYGFDTLGFIKGKIKRGDTDGCDAAWEEARITGRALAAVLY